MKNFKIHFTLLLLIGLLYRCGSGRKQENDTSYIDEINRSTDNKAQSDNISENKDTNKKEDNTKENPDGLQGETLRNWLKKEYFDKQHKTLGYKQARRYMYNFIDNQDGTIEGVYAGYKKQWRYGGRGTNPMPINCEHTVPQSFFNKREPMKSDLHHLFPTYAEWNRVRSNYGFAEIDDQTTTQWMRIKEAKRSIPEKGEIDEYSEFANEKFEPRELHKGNLARAVFYFYTMYPDEIESMQRVANLKTLYQWHINDPVDERERKRNEAIAKYQGNRNPYIDKPELIKQAWSIKE